MIGNFLKWGKHSLSSHLSMALPFLLLFLLPPGCQGPWEAYQEIELGKPIPQNSILVQKGIQDGNNGGYFDCNMLPFPTFAGQSRMTVHQEDGNAVKKEYWAMAYGDWIFFQTGRTRVVTECILPANAQFDPPKDWKYSNEEGRQFQHQSEYRNAADCLFHSFSDEFMESDSSRMDDLCKTFPLTLMYLTPIYANLVYISSAEHFFFLSKTNGNMLQGLSQEGYELIYQTPKGGKVTIHNLGEGRIRMEMIYPRICNTFLVTICCMDSFNEHLEQEFRTISGVWKVRHNKGEPVRTYTCSQQKNKDDDKDKKETNNKEEKRAK